MVVPASQLLRSDFAQCVVSLQSFPKSSCTVLEFLDQNISQRCHSDGTVYLLPPLSDVCARFVLGHICITSGLSLSSQASPVRERRADGESHFTCNSRFRPEVSQVYFQSQSMSRTMTQCVVHHFSNNQADHALEGTCRLNRVCAQLLNSPCGNLRVNLQSAWSRSTQW